MDGSEADIGLGFPGKIQPGMLNWRRKDAKEISMNVRGFAFKLKSWMTTGIEELGDTKGNGLGATIRSVVQDSQFLESPKKAATTAWLAANKNAASNGAIMRTAPLGIIGFPSLDAVIKNTKQYCKATHVDQRAVASCVAATTTIATILKMGQQFDPHDVVAVGKVATKALKAASDCVDDAAVKKELKVHFSTASLQSLHLDDSDKIGYTFKALGCVGYVLNTCTDFARAIHEITLEAGDSDTNAAIACAVLGCKLGFSAIPTHLVSGLVHQEWLEERVNRLLRLLGLKSTLALPTAAERKTKRKGYLCGNQFAVASRLTKLTEGSLAKALWQGDITALEVDAIVNVADPDRFPEPVGALDQQVHRAAGPSFLQECSFVGKVSVGSVEIVPGCMLPASCTLLRWAH